MLGVYIYVVVCLLEYPIYLFCMITLTDEEENCASQLPPTSGMCIPTVPSY